VLAAIRQRADLPGGSRRLPLHPAREQSYAHVLFFMTDADVTHLKKSGSWSLGVGPNIVVIDAGAAKDVSTLTVRKGVHVFVFAEARHSMWPERASFTLG
jgi:hypothetical protein